jgi:hypothetical protein
MRKIMKNIELGNFNAHEITLNESKIINGGSELSEDIVRGAGYIAHKFCNWFREMHWEDWSIDLIS